MPPGCVPLLVQEITRASLKYYEALVMIAVGGTDVRIRLPVNLRKFIEGQCIVGLCFVERGGALMHKHFQMVMKGNFTSPLLLNKICRYGYDESGVDMENHDKSS